MLFLDDLKYMKLYKKHGIYLPINKKDKKHGSAILLLTPNYSTSNKLMNNPFFINRNDSFVSYYVEKDIMYTIQHESRLLEIQHNDYTQIINEQPSVFVETTNISCTDNLKEDSINELYCKLGDKVIFFNEFYDEEIFKEAKAYNTTYKRLLYNDRIRNNREVFNIYKTVKNDNPWIKKTFINYDRYKTFNIFIDLYYYNQAFLNNNTFTVTRSIDMYFEFIKRFINDKRIDKAGYTKKTVFVPVYGWNSNNDYDIYNYLKNLNPISAFYKKMKLSLNDLNVFNGLDFVFFGDNGYFKMEASKLTEESFRKFARLISALTVNELIDDSDTPDNSPDGITNSIIDKLEKNNGIVVHSLTGKADTIAKDKPEKSEEQEKEEKKAEMVKKISDAAQNAKDEDEVLDKLESDEDLKRIIADLQEDPDNGTRISAVRASRITKAQGSLMEKKFQGKSIKSMVNDSNKPKELPEKELPIKTINTEWKHLKAVNFEKEYDLDADIVKCLNSLSSTDKEFPVSILDIQKEDTSTSEDSIYTYTVKCEDYNGKRFTLKFDIPKFRDNRFMRLRGNDKIFSIEMPLIPISKTDPNTVQICSFYNKIFIETYYTSSGKTNPYTDILVKAISKYKGKNVKVVIGDNSKICHKYELPIDYIDLASIYSRIEVYSKMVKDNVTIYFNQDEIRAIKGVDPKNGIPIAVTGSGKVMYYTGNNDGITLSQYIISIINDQEFIDLINAQTPARKSTYSRASILNTNIPVIVILAHDIGLTKAMNLAGIKYDISEKKNKTLGYDSIRLSDCYINYEVTYDSLMLMNGLKDCNMEDYSVTDINSKMMWVSVLDNFGGRIKSDGLDNFKDLMFDPVTVEVCRDYDLPETYHEALIYASNLLVDNKYTIHKDLSTNRYRTNEVIAAQFYRILSDSYRDYALQNKHGRKVTMSMNKSAVIDLILSQNTTSDLSIFQPLLEIEAKNTISTKGVTGMNSERAYKIDKRGYDDSMVNIIAQATGFASTVGVNRQTTINPNIVGGRGYFKQSGVENMNVVNTLCMTEALSPYTVSSDDPFRNDMTFVQTAKHSTPIEYGTPLLVTTGADAAMPYLSSDMFCHKAKGSGKVTELNDKYMIITYKNGTKEYVNLDEQTMKNSDGGFYITLQLKTDLKLDSTVKEDQIVAYDKKSFSNRVGLGQVAYNLGCLVKVAIMTTEDGFEDSGVFSEWLSEAMASNIVVNKTITLPASTNVLFIATKGQEVTEGEPILIFQNAFDDKDANILLKNLNDEDGDVSEIGRNVVKSKVTGRISDIKIYRTCDIDENMSDSMKKIITNYERGVNRLKKVADGCSNAGSVQLSEAGKLPPTGKLKNVDGVRIEIYMEYHDKLGVGDKITNLNANKNTAMYLYSDEDAPYTDFRPTEHIDAVNSCSAIDGRMICSPFLVGGLNKLMIELWRKCCDIMNIKWPTLHEIYDEDMKKK
jgi:hypothetical protein